MNIVRCLSEWQALRPSLRGSVGFVPTMGALHEGHLSLLRASLENNDVTVLSIYVNATQFNDPADLAKYPNTLEADLAAARAAGVDWVLVPDYSQIYADGYRYQLNEESFSQQLCGTDRPGHFTGVLTVVMKLLNLVRPDRAYFGLKDFQQFTRSRTCATLFYAGGNCWLRDRARDRRAAMSSRNQLLTDKGRQLAGSFNRLLVAAASDEHAPKRWRPQACKLLMWKRLESAVAVLWLLARAMRPCG